MEASTPAPTVPPLKAYKFKEDYSFDHEQSNVEPTPLWTVKKDDVVVGRPFHNHHPDANIKGDWIGLAGSKSGLVKASLLEEVPLTDEILKANHIVDVRNIYFDRPSWLRRKWNAIYEWWYYIFKAQYYIVRRKVENKNTNDKIFALGSITEEMYLSRERDTSGKTNFIWSSNPEEGFVFGFIASLLLIRMLKKQKKNAGCEFSLITTGDMGFIQNVIGKKTN